MSLQGAEGIEIDAHGDLVLRTAVGEVREHKPAVYQEIAGSRELIASSYVLRGKDEVGFAMAEYDSSRPLVIDPTLSYSTYLGGNDDDTGRGIAVDSAGNAYVTGDTGSHNFPFTLDAYATENLGSGDAFVTKLKADGSQLLFSTFLGGSGNDSGDGIAVDSTGSAYVAGRTRSTDFRTTTGAFQPTSGGMRDAFIAKIVAAPNFSLSLSPTTRTIAAGQSATYTFTVTPQELIGTVALSCAGAPDAATCGISPASVALEGDGTTAAQTATVTVTTTARSLLWPTLRFPAGPSGPRLGLLLGILLVLLVTLAMLAKIGRRATN